MKTPVAITFGRAAFVLDQDHGDFVGLSNMTGPELVKMYNELAFELGTAEVARFSDTKAAIRRTWAQLQAYAAAKPETQVSADASGEHRDVAPGVQTKAGDPAVRAPAETPDLGGVSPGKVEAVGVEPKQERLKAAAKDAIKAKPTPAAPITTPKPKPGASKDPAKDAEMPALRRALKPVELAPKPKVYPRKAGSKQALLVDLLSRPEGATFGELYDALAAGGKPWKGVTIRSGLAWDMNHLAGYGVTSTALTGEEFAQQGRWYEAERLGVKNKAHAGGPYILGDAYDPTFKLLVYRLTYPKGLTAPLPHTPRAGPSAEQKAAASAALLAALKNGGEV